MHKSRITTIIAALLLLLFTSACSQGQQSTEAPSTGDSTAADTAALVNGKPVSMADLRTAVRNVTMQNGMDASHLDAFMSQFGPRVLDQLIEAELLYQAADKADTLATEGDINDAFSELTGRYTSLEDFNAEMETRGFTESSLKTSIGRQISIQKFIQETIVPQAVVPEETVREAYDQNPQRFTTPEEVKASHILINSAESDPQEKKDEALKRAKAIAAQAKESGADFAELAREHSEGPSAPSGGELGFFTRGRMVKPFEDAAFSMKVNQVSDPVLTQFGYHIIKVTDRKESSTVSYEDAKDRLQQDLTNRMINEMIGQKLSSLKEDSTIEILFEPAPPETPGEIPMK